MSATRSTYARPTPEWLAHLYTGLGLGCPDIGWLYERDAKTVLWWLRQAGVPTRSRGSNPAVHFKAGQRSSFAGHKHTVAARAAIGAKSLGRELPQGDSHWLRRVGPERNPNWKGGATPQRQEFYRSAEWKSVVRVVWARANKCCERCTLDWRTVDRATTPTFHVHHCVSFAVPELRADVDNLVLLCRPCHLWVHSKANAEGLFLAVAEEWPQFRQRIMRSVQQPVCQMAPIFVSDDSDAMEAGR